MMLMLYFGDVFPFTHPRRVRPLPDTMPEREIVSIHAPA